MPLVSLSTEDCATQLADTFLEKASATGRWGEDGVENLVSNPGALQRNSITRDPLPPYRLVISSGGTRAKTLLLVIFRGPGIGVKILNPADTLRLSRKVSGFSEQNLYVRAKELVGDRDPRHRSFQFTAPL